MNDEREIEQNRLYQQSMDAAQRKLKQDTLYREAQQIIQRKNRQNALYRAAQCESNRKAQQDLRYKKAQAEVNNRAKARNNKQYNRSKKDIPLLAIHIKSRTAQKKCLLKDINLQISAGKLVLILGGSGAGKTTFMNAVMGYEPADGEILYKGKDLYKNYENIKHVIGYVPQKDDLRKDTVYSTIYNSAQMRLPVGADIEKATFDAIQSLGLENEMNSMADKLSGGQRKRLSVAVEYVANPTLFFLDEPDSGLDGSMARELFRNLRQIANQGRIVMVISHSPDRVAELIDTVIVLAKSNRDNCGHLAFWGTPTETCRFFEVSSLELILDEINLREEGGKGRSDFFIDKFNREREY